MELSEEQKAAIEAEDDRLQTIAKNLKKSLTK